MEQFSMHYICIYENEKHLKRKEVEKEGKQPRKEYREDERQRERRNI